MAVMRIIKKVTPKWTRIFGGKSKKENGFRHKATQPTTASPLFLVLFSALIAACGQGEATFDTTLSETVDDLGNFKIPFKATGPILIEADGVHFNEVTGQLSQSRLQLRAIYNVIDHADQR